MKQKRWIISIGTAALLLMLSFSSAHSITDEKDTASNIAISSDDTPFTSLNGNILYVGGSGEGNYTTIQSAVENASNGDTVFVYDDSSPYYESFYIAKSINLIGENRETTIIDSNGGHSYVIGVYSQWVNISGFTIQNSGALGSGVRVHLNHTNISNNILRYHFYGVELWGNHNVIGNNMIYSNGQDGIHLQISSNYNLIHDNDMYYNFHAVFIDSWTRYNTIRDNKMHDNGCCGMLIWGADNLIIRNHVYNNSGIMCLTGGSSNINNTIYHNNFINNNRSVRVFSYNIWDNGYPSGGNYWDEYIGVDIEPMDGIGDTPYNISGANQDQYPLMYPYPGCMFIRGDVNTDGIIIISDVINLLYYLFVPGATIPTCMDAADVNDDGEIDMSDVIYLLRALYIPGTDPIPPPCGDINNPECGTDPTLDNFGCNYYPEDYCN